MNKSKLKKITSARLFLPIVCLIAVLLINVIKTPDFFNITIRNGVLYGYVIDVSPKTSENMHIPEEVVFENSLNNNLLNE